MNNEKQPKYYRCKNRKRFIKLLMSCGNDRNSAIYYAEALDYYQHPRQPYPDRWLDYVLFPFETNQNIKALTNFDFAKFHRWRLQARREGRI